LLPKGGNINVQVADTFSVYSYTVREDSVKTDSLSRAILGAMYDPEFGVSVASLYTQALLPEINLNFGTTPSLDSIVLILKYESGIASYGNLKTSQELDVYKLAESLLPEKQYYHNNAILKGAKIGSYSGKFSPSDSVTIKQNNVDVKVAPHLRIRLDDAFGNEFLNASPSSFSGYTAFLDFFKGLAVIPKSSVVSSGTGAIVPLDLISNFSALVLYYNDSSKKEFPISSGAQKVLLYDHPIMHSDILNQFNNPGNTSISYVQAMGGAKSKVLIPNLKNLVADGGKIVVQEASITLFPLAGSVTSDYPAPLRLFLFQPNSSDGGDSPIVDLTDYIFPPEGWSNTVNYGGNYNSSTGGYTFHFSRHLQQLLDGKIQNRGFYITIPNDFPITPSRLKIDNTRTKVKIVYTKL
jgi:hypothetical protein